MNLAFEHVVIICIAVFIAGTCFGVLLMSLVQMARDERLPKIEELRTVPAPEGD